MTSIKKKDFNILIADENSNFRSTLTSTLRLQGFNVEFANGGFHLIHLIEKLNNYHIIIIHENMQDMSAMEIILLIRTMRSKTELPILFISQIGDEKTTFDMILSGANEYIVKSENFQSIINRVQKYYTLFEKS